MPSPRIGPRMFAALGVLTVAGFCGCGSEPAPVASPEDDPGTPATLVLDTPGGAVDAGVYASKVSGATFREGISLDVREVSGEESAPELLEAGEADAAIMGIDDFGRAVDNGIPLVGIGAIVQPSPKPLLGQPAEGHEVPYPRLILVASEDGLRRDQEKLETLIDVLDEGYSDVVADPEGGLSALLYYQDTLDGERERARLAELLRDGAFVPPLQLDPRAVRRWAESAVRRGVLRDPDVGDAFRFDS